MKSRIISALAALILAAVPASHAAAPSQQAAIYPMAAQVYAIDAAADTVTIATASGELFSYYGADGLAVGEIIACIVSDNGTPADITDDIIMQATPTGYSVGKQSPQTTTYAATRAAPDAPGAA